MLQRSSGGNYPAITEDELGCVLIPLPELNVQRRIAKEAADRQAAARYLRIEATHLWEEATRHFEAELLGLNASDPGGRALL